MTKKKIPVKVYEEIKDQTFLNILYNLQADSYKYGIPIKSTVFVNEGGKYYLVSYV